MSTKGSPGAAPGWTQFEIAMSFLERDGLKLKQGEWNILQMGTTKYETNCKQLRFKDVYLETTHLPAQKTIPLMTDLIIDVSFLADPSPW